MTDKYGNADIRHVINPVTIIMCDNVHRIVLRQQMHGDPSTDASFAWCAGKPAAAAANWTARRCASPAWYVLSDAA